MKYMKYMKYMKSIIDNKIKILFFLIFIISLLFILKFIVDLYMTKKSNRVVIFDMDETLGYFTELGVMCDILERYNKKTLSFKEFYNIMNLYPEFFRPNILKILLYLKTKKKNKECDKVIIYTNNQGPKKWAEYIKKFFEKKINYKLFDKIIGAYKIDGVQVEPERTSHEKSVEDFFQITKLPKDTKICFLDDQYHHLMDYNNVYYIHVRPYTYNIPFNILVARYYDSQNIDQKNIIDRNSFINKIVSQMKKYNLKIDNRNESKELNTQKSIGNDILNHLNKFFKTFKNNYTHRNLLKTKKSKNVTSKHKKYN